MSGRQCACQNAVQLKKQNKLLTVICADPSDVIRLQDEVTWFDPSLKLTVFPDWETLPYDVLSPHADLVGERLQTLYLLLNRQKRQDPVDVLIVSASTATQRLAPRNYIGSTTFFFRKGDRIDPTDLRAELVARGYEHVSQVVAPGEFASRGGLLDLFPMGAPGASVRPPKVGEGICRRVFGTFCDQKVHKHRIVKRSENMRLPPGIHFLIVPLVFPRGDVVHPLLVGEVPPHGLLDALLELQRRFPAQLLLEFARVDGVAQVVPGPVGDVGDQLLRSPFGPSQQAVHRPDDHPDQVDVPPLVETADVVRLAVASPVEYRVDGPGVVLDVEPVADVFAPAVDRQRLFVADVNSGMSFSGN